MKKLRISRKKDTHETPGRITNDTVSEHRKRVLAGGRKFKYPLQYSRHKLVINTIVISVFAVIAVIVFGWWQLYPLQNTSTFAYRVTSVIPLPVAEIGGEQVRYSDYLLKFRSAEHYLQQKEQSTLNGEDSERQRTYLKQQSLKDAIADAYALRLAREKNVTVTQDELATFLKSKRQVEGGEITERTHYAVIRDYYDWSPAEYEHVMRTKLIRQKVAYAIDEKARMAKELAENLLHTAKPTTSWQRLVAANADRLSGATYGKSGMVSKENQDGGLAIAAAKLKKGEISEAIRLSTEDGYYYTIVRLIESNAKQVNYEFVSIPLTELNAMTEAQYNENKVHVYIGVQLEEEK